MLLILSECHYLNILLKRLPYFQEQCFNIYLSPSAQVSLLWKIFVKSVIFDISLAKSEMN